jgi:predicted neutral ceramidase superfamily lipid hydrolase
VFIGHYGVGLAAKKIDNRPSLGTLFLAAQFLDILWPVFILLGLERVEIDPMPKKFLTLHFTSYPLSHSLAAALVWSLLFGLVYYWIRKNVRVSTMLGLLVLSHWILDLIVHIPDLQLIPGSDMRVGLGLWNSTMLTIIIEGLIFIIGIYLYLKSTKAKNLRGSIALWSLIIFLSFAYVMNLVGPPPPSVNAIGFAGLSQWLIIAWAYWADRNRKSAVEKVS